MSDRTLVTKERSAADRSIGGREGSATASANIPAHLTQLANFYKFSLLWLRRKTSLRHHAGSKRPGLRKHLKRLQISLQKSPPSQLFWAQDCVL